MLATLTTLAAESSSSTRENFAYLDHELWHWFALLGFITTLVIIDLLLVHRNAHVISFKEAAIESAVWISIGLAFTGVIYWLAVPGDEMQAAGEYLSGFLIEKSLSIDNVFVWAVIFSFFAVPKQYQFRVLFWGIFGALVLRAIFIVAGVELIERFDWILYVFGAFLTQTGLAASAVALWALWASGVRDPYAILALVAVAGTFHGLNRPAWQSFVHDLVPRRDLASAVGLNSLQLNAARAVGPAVAGVLLATLGPGWAFLFNAVSFAFVIAALLLVHTTVVVSHQPRSSVIGGFVSAVRYIGAQPGIQCAILVSVLVGILGNPIFGFTVVFASDVFHVGAVGLGGLNAVLGIGSVIAAPIVTSARGSLGRTVRWAFPLFALAMGGFAAAPNAWTGGVMLVVVGGCFLSVISSANTAMQLIVADHMRGRVLAVRIMLFTLSFPVGSLIQGWVSDRIGPRAAVLGAAGVMLLVGLFLALWRGGRILDRLDDPHDEALPAEQGRLPAGRQFSTLRHKGWSPADPGSTLRRVPLSPPRSETQ